MTEYTVPFLSRNHGIVREMLDQCKSETQQDKHQFLLKGLDGSALELCFLQHLPLSPPPIPPPFPISLSLGLFPLPPIFSSPGKMSYGWSLQYLRDSSEIQAHFHSFIQWSCRDSALSEPSHRDCPATHCLAMAAFWNCWWRIHDPFILRALIVVPCGRMVSSAATFG